MALHRRSLFRGLTPSGLVIAGVGFFLTRFTVTLVTDTDPVTFLLVGLGPSWSVSGCPWRASRWRSVRFTQCVRTVALWTVTGTASMAVLVGITLYDQSPAERSMAAIRRETCLSNFLIGGCVGGTLTIYAAAATSAGGAPA